MTRNAHSIPAPTTDRSESPLTLAAVNADHNLARRVRDQGARIRAEAAATGEAWFAGWGYHNDTLNIRTRDFAFRVLVAHGELVQDPTDSRRYTAA